MALLLLSAGADIHAENREDGTAVHVVRVTVCGCGGGVYAMRARVCDCLRVRACVRARACVFVCICVCMWVCTCVHVCA